MSLNREQLSEAFVYHADGLRGRSFSTPRLLLERHIMSIALLRLRVDEHMRCEALCVFPILSKPTGVAKYRLRALQWWLTFSAITAATFLATSWATAITISTSANPVDGWRTIAPVGDLNGLPITDVGLEWEAGNLAWNSSLTFDDSAAAGWHGPVPRDVSPFGGTSTNHIWSDGPDGSGNTPAYFRKTFVLDVLPAFAHFGSSIPNDYSNVVDDDVQIYINGQLVFNDQDGLATFLPVTDAASFLQAGANLLAVKAHDSFGGNEHFSLTLSISWRMIGRGATRSW